MTRKVASGFRWGSSALPLLLGLAWLCWGCGGASDQSVQRKLGVVLDDDLQTMVEEIRAMDSGQILDRPYYQILQYETYEKSTQYSHRAVVKFYYFKSIQMIQTRKYRFEILRGQWQRYYKALDFNWAK